MPEHRLQYEFARLGQLTSTGFTTPFPGLSSTGTTSDGAEWYMVTDYINEPDNVVFSFGKSEDDKEEQLDSTGIEKGVSSKVSVFGLGYSYVRQWLIDHPSASINSLQCRITDVSCIPEKSMGIWEVKSDNLTWCEDGECTIDINLSEYTPIGNCLKSTLIADNHRNWFPEDGVVHGKTDPVTGLPLPDYIHPVYQYCIDIKPQMLQNFLFVIAQTLSFAFGALILIIQAVLDFIDWVITQLGGSFSGDDNFADSVNDGIADIFEQLIGCNRRHPAPLVRNYFINGCSKCGVEFESNIFNDPSGPVPLLYNASMLFAPNRHGYKENEIDNDFKDWIPSNTPYETILSYAYSLKGIFNAKFKLENGVFSFNTKNEFPTTIVFDFTTDEDRALLLDSICYGWNAQKKPASLSVKYAQDVKDVAGDEAEHRYSGAKDWADPAINPFYDGTTEITTELYSAARFATDGIDRKLIFVKLDNQPFWPDSVLLIEKGVTQLYKLLIWDGTSDINQAQVVKKHITTEYVLKWQDEYVYGITPAEDYYVFNYPLLFDWNTNEGYNEFGPYPPSAIHKNIYELHKIDDPTQSGLQNKSWRLTLELCCTTLNKLVFDDTSQDGIMCHLDYLVQLNANEKGVINRVEIDYSANEIRLEGEIKYTV